jgi:hypothetical protein
MIMDSMARGVVAEAPRPRRNSGRINHQDRPVHEHRSWLERQRPAFARLDTELLTAENREWLAP